jgi:tRNA A-37 threonylcarbamoyl transferase component Bud32
MAFVDICPASGDLLSRCGLRAARDFFELGGVVVGGHRDRNVARVEIGTGPGRFAGFLKLEHRVAWKDRLANSRAGFGFVSKSLREAATLKALASRGLGGPDYVAAGEDGRGRAFLLVREAAGFQDLRTFLREFRQRPARARRGFARRLGESLARLHASGFVHGDLYSKHVLVHPDRHEVRLVDWQRGRCRKRLKAVERWRDLAALNATLAEPLAEPRERLVFLRAYLCAAELRRGRIGQRRIRRSPARIIRRLTQRLLSRRRIRELRGASPTVKPQELIRIEGEALCVTPEFRASLRGGLPEWLADWHRNPCAEGLRRRLTRTAVRLPYGDHAELARRWLVQPLAALWCWFRGKELRQPELRHAGLIFRLQRYGVATPRLLAFGQRHSFPGRSASFLLTQSPRGAVRLDAWFARQDPRRLWTVERKQRRHVARALGQLLWRMHNAGWCLGRNCPPRGLPFKVLRGADGNPSLMLGTVEGLRRCRGAGSRRACADVSRLVARLRGAGLSRTEAWVLLRAYDDRPGRAAARHLARALRNSPWVVRSRRRGIRSRGKTG